MQHGGEQVYTHGRVHPEVRGRTGAGGAVRAESPAGAPGDAGTEGGGAGETEGPAEE